MILHHNINIQHLFSSKIPCIAKSLCIIENESDLPQLTPLLKHYPHWVILGKGSNTIPDKPFFNGLVITLGPSFDNIHILPHQHLIIASANTPIPSITRISIQNEWSGFERFGGIPGTIAGGVVMNAGVGPAGKYSISQSIQEVFLYNIYNGFHSYSPTIHDFAYRHSIFSKKEDIIYKVSLRFQKTYPLDTLQSLFKENMAYRKQTQPLQFPNWGSTFKNPLPLYAAQLIEESGLKGLQIGNMQVSPKHANFLVNLGNATSLDAISLISNIQDIVLQKHGIPLQREVQYLHESAHPTQPLLLSSSPNTHSNSHL